MRRNVRPRQRDVRVDRGGGGMVLGSEDGGGLATGPRVMWVGERGRLGGGGRRARVCVRARLRFRRGPLVLARVFVYTGC